MPRLARRPISRRRCTHTQRLEDDALHEPAVLRYIRPCTPFPVDYVYEGSDVVHCYLSFRRGCIVVTLHDGVPVYARWSENGTLFEGLLPTTPFEWFDADSDLPYAQSYLQCANTTIRAYAGLSLEYEDRFDAWIAGPRVGLFFAVGRSATT